ncbi:hypothetical protein VP01_2069g4 [Puccinia sorghi]|uniref:Uncharacterized protein n=1 Tax=Puccinia sorghi TaxID=27349 RepID=A0A0L6VB56_9BASI|nr:hypothetical protein VP01_2069g4 [Puccinia sorghi]
MSYQYNNSNPTPSNQGNLAARNAVIQQMLEKIQQLEIVIANGAKGKSGTKPKKNNNQNAPTIKTLPTKPIKKKQLPKPCQEPQSTSAQGRVHPLLRALAPPKKALCKCSPVSILLDLNVLSILRTHKAHVGYDIRALNPNSSRCRTSLQVQPSTALIATKDIQMLRDAKVVFIEYMWATMAKFGIRVWAPDLDAQPDSLYNEACCLSAITTFQQAVINKVYAYMGINNEHVTNMVLLEWVYDHYVHYYMAGIYAKEKKEKGKHTQDELKKNDTSLPSTMVFQSVTSISSRTSKLTAMMTANTFMCCLDDVMKKAFKKTPGNPQPFLQTLFPKAPIGLLIDFYNHEWFNLSSQNQSCTRVVDHLSAVILV